VRQVLIDLNVILDVVLDRQPHAEIAARLWAALESGRAKGYLPAHGFTTVYDLVERAQGAAFARRAIGVLLAAFGVAPVTEAVLRRAVALAWPDLEDAVCAAAAEAAGCDVIASRDPSGFPNSPVRVSDPATILAWLASE
jgi:predicted nucleic acid-binding protein